MRDQASVPPYNENRAIRLAATSFREAMLELRGAATAIDAHIDSRDAVPLAQNLTESAERVLLAGVALDRARGRSWEAVGVGLGITRQAAHERFASRLGQQLPAIRDLASQGRGDSEDVQAIEQKAAQLERLVAPDPE